MILAKKSLEPINDENTPSSSALLHIPLPSSSDSAITSTNEEFIHHDIDDDKQSSISLDTADDNVSDTYDEVSVMSIESLEEQSENNVETMKDGDMNVQRNITTDVIDDDDDCDSDTPNIKIIDYFICPEEHERNAFFKYHPQQDVSHQKIFKTKDETMRKWLTFDKKKDALFCSMCLVFGKKTSSFSTCGVTDRKHWASRVQEHEKSQAHLNSIRDYLAWTHDFLIEQGFQRQLQIGKDKVMEKRAFLSRVIDVIKFIGKSGLPYRGHKNESAHSLSDLTQKHGVFLELILLLTKYDKITEDHVNECIKVSSEALLKRKPGKKKVGRGGFVTLMSKTTVNLILDIIGDMIKTAIAVEVIKARMFSVQIDTTQDISTKDQVSIVLRYLNANNDVKERLFAMLDGVSSKGSYYYELVKDCLKKYGIDILNCISDSTDGASNMQGIYKGFATLLKNEIKSHIHTWCYAHVLNLVMGDVTGSVLDANCLFSLLNDLANFFKKSYKKMKKWELETRTSSNVAKRLQSVGETRWWAKDKALTTVFGSFDNPDSSLFIKVLLSLYSIIHDDTFAADQKSKASCFFDQLQKYETIMTAHIFLRLFSTTTRLSKYLQTSGLDLLTAKRMINQASADLKKIQREFDSVQSSAEKFVTFVNDELRRLDTINEEERSSLKLESKFEKKRSRPNPVGWYKVNVYNAILDTSVNSFGDRFTEETTGLMVDLSFLHPRVFPKLSKDGLPENAMKLLADALKSFDDTVTAAALRKEMIDLSNLWSIIKLSPLDEYEYVPENITNQCSDDESDDDLDLPTIPHTKKDDYCKNCPICVFLLLTEYNMLTNAFQYVGNAYRFLLTLSVTQVACERSFSALKIVKTRVRSQLSQEHLETFMLMMCEHDIVLSIKNDTIIDRVAHSSRDYARMLQL